MYFFLVRYQQLSGICFFHFLSNGICLMNYTGITVQKTVIVTASEPEIKQVQISLRSTVRYVKSQELCLESECTSKQNTLFHSCFEE
jgi:hypothetical protein